MLTCKENNVFEICNVVNYYQINPAHPVTIFKCVHMKKGTVKPPEKCRPFLTKHLIHLSLLKGPLGKKVAVEIVN